MSISEAESLANNGLATVTSLSVFRSVMIGKKGGSNMIPELIKLANALSLNTRRTLENEAFYLQCSDLGDDRPSTLTITYAPVSNLEASTAKLQLTRDTNYLYSLTAHAGLPGSKRPYSASNIFHGPLLPEMKRQILCWAAIAAQGNEINKAVVRDVSIAATSVDAYAESFRDIARPAIVQKYLDGGRKTVSLLFRRLQDAPKDENSRMYEFSLHDDTFDEMLAHARDLCDSINRHPVTGGGFRVVREETYPVGGRFLKVEYDFDAKAASRPVALPPVAFSFREHESGSYEVLAESRDGSDIPQIFAPEALQLFFQARAKLHDWARAAIGSQSGGQRGALENFIEIAERLGGDPLAQSWSPLDGGPKR